jgi:radical SAM superfamily enzyme YgiQ (UPF0313 family)
MTTVPVPRFDLLDLSEYASLSVQYSRGCPFQCEFCDIIEIFGRKPRVKEPEQVIDELEAIYRLGYKGTLFFVDDNFIGNKPAVKRLLPILRDWQRQRGHPFELYTEASVDLATDPPLLHGMVDAGFASVFLGIETPSVKALEQAKKLQNLRVDPSEAIDRITRAGIEVMGGFIVGFDSDGPEIFAQQQRIPRVASRSRSRWLAYSPPCQAPPCGAASRRKGGCASARTGIPFLAQTSRPR